MANHTPPEYLLVGTIVKPHGIRGDVAMRLETDFPERLLEADILYIGAEYTPHEVQRIRRHSSGMLVQLAGINDRNEAEVLRKAAVYIHIDEAIPLEDGEYYLYEIQGIQVVTDAGKILGQLTDFIETGANDVYIVTSDEGGEILLPAIPEVILDVNLEEHVMTVHILDGLL